MRILITGVNGQLGYELSRVLRDDNHEIIGTTRKIMDITDFTKVREFINRVEPDMVIHCADVYKRQKLRNLFRNTSKYTKNTI